MILRTLPAVLLLVCAQDPQCDVLHMKDGSVREGFILAEKAEAVTLEILMKGSKGEINGLIKVDFPRADIARIERMPDEGRKQARKRAAWFADRRKRLAAALAKIRPAPAAVEGKKGLRAVGSFFEVLSTCDERFLKEVTYDLELVFDAYQEFFSIQRKKTPRIKVYLFADKAEFQRFQIDKIETVVDNPAFYHSEDNYIAAYNMIQKEEAAKIRDEIHRLEQEIRDWKKKSRDEEKRVKEEAQELRREIARQAKAAKDQGAAPSAVKEWQSQQMKKLKELERQANKDLRKFRKEANKAIEQCQKVISHNARVLKEQNKAMFEMLYHEAFHAFVNNLLWEKRKTEIPRWLNEGMACYFERSVVENGSLVHGAVHPGFMKLLGGKMKENELHPLTKILKAGVELFVVAHGQDPTASGTCYAQSWLLVHYMTRKLTREQIDAYVESVTVKGRDPVAAFEKMMVQTTAQVEAALRKHHESLK
ncbi:MAG: DUF1570 domain-containing protein [Planctomycetota bacterium]|jgi:flagellar biosynthesis GTPase FlhF